MSSNALNGYRPAADPPDLNIAGVATGSIRRLPSRYLHASLSFVLGCIGIAGLVSPVAAQQTSSSVQPYLVPVMLWTFVTALLAMFVLSLAYLYRKTRGDQDELIPKYVPPAEGSEEPSEPHDAVASHGGAH